MDDGFGIKLSIESFSVKDFCFTLVITHECYQIDCATGSLTVFDGPDDSGTGITYCDSDVPSIIQSSTSYLYIVYTSTDSGNSFKGTWEKVESMAELK